MTHPSRQELLARAEKYINMTPADGRGTALLVMELADALRAGDTQSPAREALQNLVAKLELCHADGRYQGVWTLAHMRLGAYSGPQYADELEAAKAVLETAPPSTHQREGGE